MSFSNVNALARVFHATATALSFLAVAVGGVASASPPGGDAFTPIGGRQELWMKATALKEQSNNMRQKFLAVALALLASVGFTAYAQETTSGSIQGTVDDAQGATVPGATVTITSAQGAKTFVTDNNGRFFAPFISPGKVSIRVKLTGFSPVEQKRRSAPRFAPRHELHAQGR